LGGGELQSFIYNTKNAEKEAEHLPTYQVSLKLEA